MPGFANSLRDDELAALLAYVRRHFSDGPPWPHVEKDIFKTRSGARPVMVRPAPRMDSMRATGAA